MELNIAENRNHLNYSKWIYVKRILWTFGKFFFRNSPRIAFGYRNTILRLFGAKIGKHFPYKKGSKMPNKLNGLTFFVKKTYHNLNISEKTILQYKIYSNYK